MKIAGFHNEFRFLSNFWPSKIVVCGLTFPTVEHAYQALKSPRREAWLEILDQPTPGRAKRLGAFVHIRPNWDQLKIPIMRMLLRKKFQIPELRKGLIETRPFHLEETNTWGDTFWGVNNGKGENHLGKLLMQIRNEIHDHQ